MTVKIVQDEQARARIDRLCEALGDQGKGYKQNEVMMALCMSIAAGITLSVPKEHWHSALMDVVASISINIGCEDFVVSMTQEH